MPAAEASRNTAAGTERTAPGPVEAGAVLHHLHTAEGDLQDLHSYPRGILQVPESGQMKYY